MGRSPVRAICLIWPVLGGGAAALVWLLPLMLEHLEREFSLQLHFNAQTIADPALMMTRLGNMVTVGLVGCAAFAAVVSLMAVGSTVAVGGWVQSLDWLTTGKMGLMLLLMLLVATIDVPLQKFLHKSRLKMSHQEFKQEHKESDGNPHMKGRLRQRQRELSQSGSVGRTQGRFRRDEPDPLCGGHSYDERPCRAAGHLQGCRSAGLKIRDLARSHAIPVLQSPMLARALYANAEIGQDIPSSLYTAVAQVLAYVYRLRAAMRGDAPMPGEPPVPEVPPELDPLAARAQRTQ
jgi:flagellar biosynthesis protein FlhB